MHWRKKNTGNNSNKLNSENGEKLYTFTTIPNTIVCTHKIFTENQISTNCIPYNFSNNKAIKKCIRWILNKHDVLDDITIDFFAICFFFLSFHFDSFWIWFYFNKFQNIQCYRIIDYFISDEIAYSNNNCLSTGIINQQSGEQPQDVNFEFSLEFSIQIWIKYDMQNQKPI